MIQKRHADKLYTEHNLRNLHNNKETKVTAISEKVDLR